MLTKKRFALNRIISPSMSLADFYAFTSSQGLSKVELRNDLPGKPSIADIIDGIKPADALTLAKDNGISVLSINALQKFNLPEKRLPCIEELKKLLDLASTIECPAIVLCPNNEARDKRSPARKYLDTVDALRDYGPLFAEYGIAGFVEALGFGISSLASLPAAQGAIAASGFACYRTLLDSFHHYIGPDTAGMFGMDGLGAAYETALTGLVHISGVEDNIPAEQFLDAHRILVGPMDRMGNKALIQKLDARGYLGVYSFEPFSKAVQDLNQKELAAVIDESLRFLGVSEK
jgi:2-keto-myo-inositol isomerase